MIRQALPQNLKEAIMKPKMIIMVLVYYRNPRDRYDRVMGTGSINTLNRISY